MGSSFSRTRYILYPEQPVPLVRGWCMLPMALINEAMMVQHPATGNTGKFIDLVMRLHLHLAWVYHLSPIRNLEVRLRHLDVGFIAFLSGLHVAVVTSYLSRRAAAFVALFSLLPMYNPRFLLRTLGLLILISFGTSLQLWGIHPEIARYTLINTGLTVISSVCYLIELRGRGYNRLIGTHDLCHLMTTVTYLHRLRFLRSIYMKW